MSKGSSTRAAVLAAAMNIIPAAPVDIFRFLNVPAIVLTIRKVKGRLCSDVHRGHARRRSGVGSSGSSEFLGSSASVSLPRNAEELRGTEEPPFTSSS